MVAECENMSVMFVSARHQANGPRSSEAQRAVMSSPPVGNKVRFAVPAPFDTRGANNVQIQQVKENKMKKLPRRKQEIMSKSDSPIPPPPPTSCIGDGKDIRFEGLGEGHGLCQGRRRHHPDRGSHRVLGHGRARR